MDPAQPTELAECEHTGPWTKEKLLQVRCAFTRMELANSIKNNLSYSAYMLKALQRGKLYLW